MDAPTAVSLSSPESVSQSGCGVISIRTSGVVDNVMFSYNGAYDPSSMHITRQRFHLDLRLR